MWELETEGHAGVGGGGARFNNDGVPMGLMELGTGAAEQIRDGEIRFLLAEIQDSENRKGQAT